MDISGLGWGTWGLGYCTLGWGTQGTARQTGVPRVLYTGPGYPEYDTPGPVNYDGGVHGDRNVHIFIYIYIYIWQFTFCWWFLKKWQRGKMKKYKKNEKMKKYFVKNWSFLKVLIKIELKFEFYAKIRSRFIGHIWFWFDFWWFYDNFSYFLF